jgi:hypothetical protein
MRNIAFVLWTVLFPVANEAANYLDFLARGSVARALSTEIQLLAALTTIAIWAVVARLLYESPE